MGFWIQIMKSINQLDKQQAVVQIHRDFQFPLGWNIVSLSLVLHIQAS